MMMGYDAACTLHLDGRATRGTALLEQHDLIFRGPFRLAIPLSQITSATSGEGALTVRFGQRTATFDLGQAAATWAKRITNPPSRLDKLGIKPGMTVRLVACADEPFMAEVEARGATVSKRAPAGGADIVFYGAERRETLDRLDRLRSSIKPDGAIWVIRPKGQQAITEADVMAAGKRAGLVDIKVVSFSDTHTAEKFVVPVRLRPNAPSGASARQVRPNAPSGASARQVRPNAPSGASARQVRPNAPSGASARQARPSAPSGTSARQARATPARVR